jgi:hypothetical protein
MEPQDRAGKGDASAEAAIRACGMQADRDARLPRLPIRDRIVTADHRTADEPHEVLRRSTDEAARARDAAREMHRPGVVATLRGFLKLLWATI